VNLDGVVIESMAVALPRNSASARDLVAGCHAPIDFEMQAITGIASTPTARAGEYSLDLAETAIQRCLARSRHPARDIDLLISGTLLNSNSPGTISLEPGMASAMKARLGFEQALTLDVSCACAGLFAALRVADAFLECNAAKRVLIFSGEFVTQAAHTAQALIESANDPRMPCLTVGDSALAMVIERASDGGGFSNLQLFTLGRYSGHCVAKPTDRAPGGVVMETDAVRLALVTSKEGLLHFQRAYATRPGEAATFDFLVPHQASASSLAGAMRDANKRHNEPLLTNENVINNLERRGNTVTTTHFLAIYDAILQGRIRNGHRLL
jgi:3-oxoacyl-[acyl-carrier-protein] synthase III